MRKEFFNIDIENLEQEIFKISKDAKFIRDIEAIEYNETKKIIQQLEENKKL